MQDEADIYPDFVTIGKGFGVPSRRVIRKDELRAAIREMLDTPGPYLLEVSAPSVQTSCVCVVQHIGCGVLISVLWSCSLAMEQRMCACAVCVKVSWA